MKFCDQFIYSLTLAFIISEDYLFILFIFFLFSKIRSVVFISEVYLDKPCKNHTAYFLQ